MPNTVRTKARWSERRRVVAFSGLETVLRRSPPTRVLDLGCGTGLWLARIAKAGHRVIGLELDPARARQAGREGPVVIGEGARIPVADAAVGLVWCLQVLHHVARPDRVLEEVSRVLRPGGQLLLSESVEDNPGIRWARDRWPSWEGVPVRSRFRAAELRQMVLGTGLEIVEFRSHSPLSFAALAVPVAGWPLWRTLRWLEQPRFNAGSDRGAYVDCVARAPEGRVRQPSV